MNLLVKTLHFSSSTFVEAVTRPRISPNSHTVRIPLHLSPSPHPPPHLSWNARRRCAWIFHLTLRPCRAIINAVTMEYPGRWYRSIISYRSVLQVSLVVVVVSLLQSPPTLSPIISTSTIIRHLKQVYCNVVHVRGYPMNIIPVVIRQYLPFSPAYEVDNCSFIIPTLCCIDCT